MTALHPAAPAPQPGAPRLLALPLALALALAAAGCSASADFPVDRRVQVQQDGPEVAGQTTLDLSASGDAWVNRRCLKGVTIRSARAVIAAVDVDNAATRGSGTLALRPSGAPDDGSADVVLGRFDDVLIRPGLAIEVAPSPEAGALVRSALEGSGRLALVMRGRADARPAAFAVEVQLDVGVRYAPLERL